MIEIYQSFELDLAFTRLRAAVSEIVAVKRFMGSAFGGIFAGENLRCGFKANPAYAEGT